MGLKSAEAKAPNLIVVAMGENSEDGGTETDLEVDLNNGIC
jgi:hypothetical protein